MSAENKALVYRWFEEVWNKGRRDAIAEMVTPDCVIHDGAHVSLGPAGFYTFFDRMRATLQDIRMTVHDTFGEGDRLCVRWSCRAIHAGDGLGIAPAGKAVEVTGISIIRVVDGKAAETWQNWDMLGMMEQVRGAREAATYIDGV